MRLLKFIDGDAPQAAVGMKFDNVSNTLSFGPNVPKRWIGQDSNNGSSSNLSGCYWLVSDDGSICALNDVVLLKSDLTPAGSTPKGVEDHHMEGVDFRNKIGRALESSRADYGVTYKKSAAKPSLMNQQEKYEKRQEAMKREREDVAQQIANGEMPMSRKSRKDATAAAVAAPADAATTASEVKAAATKEKKETSEKKEKEPKEKKEKKEKEPKEKKETKEKEPKEKKEAKEKKEKKEKSK